MSNSTHELTPKEVRAKVSICIVDDFATLCRIVKTTLGRMGFNTKNIVSIYGSDAAIECEKSLETYKNYEPELSWKIPKLLLVDWNMPRMSGLELLKKVRECSDPRITNILFIMITAEAIKENVIAAIQSGVDNYITKPLTQETVEIKFKEISTRELRKAEVLIERKSPKLTQIIGHLDLAMALDLDNKKARALKREVLRRNKNEIVQIVVNKVVTGKESANKGKYNRAVGNFHGALELMPSDPKALMEYGKMMMKKTLYEKAVSSFETAIEYLKDDIEAQQLVREVDLLDLLGEAQIKWAMVLEDSDELTVKAIASLEKVRNLFEEQRDKEGVAGSISKVGNVHAARAAEAEEKAINANNAAEKQKYKERAQEHNKLAIAEYEEAISRNIKHSATLIKLAAAYQKAGKKDSAVQVMKKALDLKPEEPEALLEFGKAFLDKNENKTAMFYFHSVMKKISAEDIEMYEEIILILLKHGLTEESIPFIKTIAEERPDLYNNLGLAYRKKNMLKEAIESYDKAIKYNVTGERVGYIFNQGMAYKKAGNIASAIKNFIKAYKTDKTFGKAAEQLEICCTELCKIGEEFLKKNDKASSLLNFKLAFVANSNSIAKKRLSQLDIDPATIMTEGELKKLGIDDPSAILEDFGG